MTISPSSMSTHDILAVTDSHRQHLRKRMDHRTLLGLSYRTLTNVCVSRMRLFVKYRITMWQVIKKTDLSYASYHCLAINGSMRLDNFSITVRIYWEQRYVCLCVSNETHTALSDNSVSRLLPWNGNEIVATTWGHSPHLVPLWFWGLASVFFLKWNTKPFASSSQPQR